MNHNSIVITKKYFIESVPWVQETNITMPNIITITLQRTDLLFDVVLCELTVVVVVFFVVLVNNGNCDNQSNDVVVG